MFKGIHKHLHQDAILLDLDERLAIPDDMDELSTKEKWEFKCAILKELIRCFDRNGKVGNPKKCWIDICNREAKATTGMGRGFAMPHVRTMQAKDFMVGIMRSDRGVYFDSMDGMPVHLFVGILTPPYADKEYLRFLSGFSRAIQEENMIDLLKDVNCPNEAMGIICRSRFIE